MNILDIRYKAMRRDGFSDEEADWYADRRIGTVNMRRLRRARRRFVRGLSEEEKETFWAQMDDYITDRIRPGEEPEENIFSPEYEDIDSIEELWNELRSGTYRARPK